MGKRMRKVNRRASKMEIGQGVDGNNGETGVIEGRNSGSENTENEMALVLVPPTQIQQLGRTVVSKRRRENKRLAMKLTKGIEEALDLLHEKTLLKLNYNYNDMNRLPPPSGTVYHKISDYAPPPAINATSLQGLLDTFKNQFMGMFETLKTPEYKELLKKEIKTEEKCRDDLMILEEQLKKQIQQLTADSYSKLKILKEKLEELGIKNESQMMIM